MYYINTNFFPTTISLKIFKISLNQPTGAISSVLSDIIQPESYEFELLIYGCSHSDAASITSQLQYVIENIIYEVSGIMVNEFLSLSPLSIQSFFLPFFSLILSRPFSSSFRVLSSVSRGGLTIFTFLLTILTIFPLYFSLVFFLSHSKFLSTAYTRFARNELQIFRNI